MICSKESIGINITKFKGLAQIYGYINSDTISFYNCYFSWLERIRTNMENIKLGTNSSYWNT
jgi:hypothetical protein